MIVPSCYRMVLLASLLLLVLGVPRLPAAGPDNSPQAPSGISASLQDNTPIYPSVLSAESTQDDSKPDKPVYSTLPPPPGWTADEFARMAARTIVDPTPANGPALIDSKRISRHKNGFFQKLALSGAWMNRTAQQYAGVTEAHIALAVALPAPTKDWPLLITPEFQMTAFNGPESGPTVPDMPPQVYATSIEFMWVPKFSEKWMGIFSAKPGVYSDWEDVQDNAVRTKARAIMQYTWQPDRLKLLLGITYLDRYDVNWLPVGGVIWTPNEDARYELIFPRPKLARCVARSGRHEDWMYVLGEFGGDSWSIQRASGQNDQVILRDLRLILGFERLRDGGAAQRFEIGYVFDRQLRFDSNTPTYEMGDTIILRAGIDF